MARLATAGVGAARLGFGEECRGREERVLVVHELLVAGLRPDANRELLVLALNINLPRLLQAVPLAKHDSYRVRLLVGNNAIDRLLLDHMLKLKKSSRVIPPATLAQMAGASHGRSIEYMLAEAKKNKEYLFSASVKIEKVAPRTPELAIPHSEKEDKEVREFERTSQPESQRELVQMQSVNAESLAAEIRPQIKRAVLQYLLQHGIPDDKEALQLYLRSSKLDEKLGVCFFLLLLENYENIE